MSYKTKTIAYLTCNKCNRETEVTEITYSEWTCSWSKIPLPIGWNRTGTEYREEHLCEVCSKVLPVRMPYGKYKGELIETLVKEAPRYMLWMDRATDFKLTGDQRDQANFNKDKYYSEDREKTFSARHAQPTNYKGQYQYGTSSESDYYDDDMDLYPDYDIPNR